MKANQVTKPCSICGKPFTESASRSARLKTCRSAECVSTIKSGANNPFYGRKHTDEARKRVSDANKDKTSYIPPRGKWHNLVCACGCGTEFELPDFRVRNVPSNRFFVNRDHMYDYFGHGNHPNFRGGPYPYGPGWTAARRAVRERDKVCQHCGKTPEENGRALDVHHRDPFRATQNNDLDNLVALCKACHRAATKLEEIEYGVIYESLCTCIQCGKEFTSKFRGRNKLCSDECVRLRKSYYQASYKATYKEKHPDVYARTRERISKWQRENAERVNAKHREARKRKQATVQDHD